MRNSDIAASNLGTISQSAFDRLNPADYPGAKVFVIGSAGAITEYSSLGTAWKQVAPFSDAQVTQIQASVSGGGVTLPAAQAASLTTNIVAADGTLIGPVAVTLAEAQAALGAASIGSTFFVSDVGGGTFFQKSVAGSLRPIGGRYLHANVPSGGNAAPAGLNVARYLAEYLIPAGLLKDGWVLSLDLFGKKAGTADAYTINVCLGTTPGTLGTSISQSQTLAFFAAGNQRAEYVGCMRFQRASATTIINNVTGTLLSEHSSGAAVTPITVTNMDTTPLYLQIVFTGTTGTAGTDVVTLMDAPLTITSNPNT